MKKRIIQALLFMGLFSSCQKEDISLKNSAAKKQFDNPELASAVNAAAKTVYITGDITQNTVFSKKNNYVISKEVHVLDGVTLTIENNTNILIQNGIQPMRMLDRAALIFNTGSRMLAETVYFYACKENGTVETLANNGGVWFLGATPAEKDGVTTPTTAATHSSEFKAIAIYAYYLGNPDPNDLGLDDNSADDLDGVSVLGLSHSSWNVHAVTSQYSGDDGFDVSNSDITLQSLDIQNPIEDAINNTSSSIKIDKSLQIKMLDKKIFDRDLFDLEVDDGPAEVIMRKTCAVDVFGYFGDQVIFESEDMPPFDPCDCVIYKWKGTLKKGPARVHSITGD